MTWRQGLELFVGVAVILGLGLLYLTASLGAPVPPIPHPISIGVEFPS